MTRPLLAASVALLTLALGACSSPTHRFAFDPSPAEIIVQPDPGGPVIARGLVTVLDGQRRGDGRPELHLRLRLTNRSNEVLRLEPESFELVGSRLEVFGRPRLDPPVVELGASAVQVWELHFPYPAGTPLTAPDLDGLSLNMAIAWKTGRVEVSVPFTRIRPVYVDTYPYGWSWSVGYHGVYCD